MLKSVLFINNTDTICNNFYEVSSELDSLVLNKDKTFRYQIDDANIYAIGTWEYLDSKLYLSYFETS